MGSERLEKLQTFVGKNWGARNRGFLDELLQRKYVADVWKERQEEMRCECLRMLRCHLMGVCESLSIEVRSGFERSPRQKTPRHSFDFV